MLAVQKALLGVVTPELRAVVVDYSNQAQNLYIRFYYDGEVPHELIKTWESAATEACADLGDCALDSAVVRIDFPNEYPFRGRLAYLRKEHT